MRVSVWPRFLATTINGTPLNRVFSQNCNMRQAYRVGVRSNCRDSEGAWFRICNLTTAQLNARPALQFRLPHPHMLLAHDRMETDAVRNTQPETEPKPLPKPKKGRR